MRPLPRHAVIAGSVVLLHAAALWALQQGLLLRQSVETLVPVSLVSELLAPTPPQVKTPAVRPPTPVPVAKPLPVREPPHKPIQRMTPAAPALPPAPLPVARPDTPPTPDAPTGTAEPQPAPPPVAAAVAAAPAPAIAAAKVELPTKDADYLHNPAPPYPALSYRLGEQGLVVVHVLIGPDGAAQDARIRKSSGYARLDNAALQAARAWRYVPGKRGGVPEAMWVDVPVNWELRN